MYLSSPSGFRAALSFAHLSHFCHLPLASPPCAFHATHCSALYSTYIAAYIGTFDTSSIRVLCASALHLRQLLSLSPFGIRLHRLSSPFCTLLQCHLHLAKYILNMTHDTLLGDFSHFPIQLLHCIFDNFCRFHHSVSGFTAFPLHSALYSSAICTWQSTF